MAEYIDREEYCEKHCRCSNEYCDKESCPIWGAPAADVAPVAHGRWKLLRKGDWTSVFICSVCGRRETIVESESYNSQLKMPKKYPYCHCGARMDGDSDAAD